MTALSGRDVGTPQKGAAPPKVYLTPKEASEICRMSESWLAKARMNGDGPPFVKFGRAVRYEVTALHEWVKTRERHSTSENDAKKRPEFTE
jgi:predicted DNA-binding transcriptional regulator AlpA